MGTDEPTKFVGKLDVASSQTVEAIRLFFGQRDLVAVHTLPTTAGPSLDLSTRQPRDTRQLPGLI
jgi:hypothetical protein